MRKFVLNRYIDTSGISGPGVVAHGVEFGDGSCVLRWNSTIASTAFYRNIEDLITIHGHDGNTIVEWEPDRCPNCWHFWDNHQRGGCEFRIKYAKDEANTLCACGVENSFP